MNMIYDSNPYAVGISKDVKSIEAEFAEYRPVEGGLYMRRIKLIKDLHTDNPTNLEKKPGVCCLLALAGIGFIIGHLYCSLHFVINGDPFIVIISYALSFLALAWIGCIVFWSYEIDTDKAMISIIASLLLAGLYLIFFEEINDLIAPIRYVDYCIPMKPGDLNGYLAAALGESVEIYFILIFIGIYCFSKRELND